MPKAKKCTGQGRGVDPNFQFKFSAGYTVANPESQKSRMESRNRPKDMLRSLVKHTRPTSLLPYSDVEKQGVSAAGEVFELTGTFAKAIKEQSAKKPTRVRTPNTAQNIANSHAQKLPDVQPIFVGSAEHPGQMKQVRLSAYKPTRETLIPPKLNANTGAALIGTDSEALGIPAQDAKEMAPEDKILFDWWNNRQAVRERRRDEEQLSQFVTYPLSNAIRQLITREEARILKEASNGKLMGITASVSSESKDTSAVFSGNVFGGSHCESRGMILPLRSMQQLFRDSRALMHDTVIGLLGTYRHGRRTAREVAEDDADDQGYLILSDAIEDESTDNANAHQRRRVSHVVDMEEMSIQLLLDSERQLASQAKEDSLLPSCVSLPPERIFTPCLVMETATSVALLWKILEQVRPVVPGMGFAIHLFEHYILPHIYDTFSSYSSTMPTLGGLSEQIMQLSTIPLRMEANRLASIAYEQSKADSKYIEYAMKHWALRGWRKNVLDRRQREVYVKNVLAHVARLRKVRRVLAVFAAWRFEARNSSNMNYLKNVRQEYVNFLNGTDFIAELPSVDGEELSPAGRNRLMATRLAETAVHVKGAPKEQANVVSRTTHPTGAVNTGSEVVASRGTLSSADLFSARSARVPPSGPQSLLAKAITSLRSASVSMVSREDLMVPKSNCVTPRPPTERMLHSSNGRLSLADATVIGNSPWSFATTQPSALAQQNQNCLPENQIEPPAKVHDLQIKASGTFEEMLNKLKEMEDVCNHLRAEIGVQSKMLRKVEQERDNLRERNRTLESELLRVTEEKMHYCNMAQEKQFILNDRDRKIIQLKSRIRAHRNRPWQRVVLRVVGELCSCSTHISESLDNLRVRLDQKPEDKKPNFVPIPRSAPSDPSDASDEGEPYEPSAQEEEERLFGKLAPVVLSSSYPLPDALMILQDWANACLDDLQDLDDLKGGVLSTRFSSFSEEARNGILLSRLLFYLSLPRYLQRTANRDQEKGAEGEEVFGTNYPDRRRQLLRKHNVQLDTPFPVYPECFGDLLSMRPSERMTLLLQFATELMAGSDMLTNNSLEQDRQKLYKTILEITDLQQPPAAGRIELQEVIDPHALAMGERASVVTFIALLYCRFSHPFNHKCHQSAEVEKAAILHLLSGGVQQRRTNFSLSKTDRIQLTMEEEIMMKLDDEDKSPWYLFKERCLPVFGTNAHPFLLRGNFWPSDAFDSPQLANILGELGMALNRSLQLHRWHVIMSCLVPVMTYSGLSRGVFTGPRASPHALRVGLEREGEWHVPLHCRCFMRVYSKRAEALRNKVREGKLSIEEVLAENPSCALQRVSSTRVEVSGGPSIPQSEEFGYSANSTTAARPGDTAFRLRTSVLMEREAQELLHAIHLTSNDLLTLFLRRSTLSAELALPTLSLGGWRLLCTDLKLLASTPEEEENAILDMDVASTIFYEAVMALNEVASSSPDQSEKSHSMRARARTFTGNALVNSRKSSLSDHLLGANWNAIPKVSDDMTFAAFLIATALVANEMYPLQNDPPVVKASINLPEDFVAFEESFREPTPGYAVAVGSNGRSDAGSPTPSVVSADVGCELENVDPSGSQFSAKPPKVVEVKLIWLGNCLQHFVHGYIPKVAGDVLSDEPRAVIHRLTMGAITQEVLARYTPAIILVFNAYSKDVYGAAGMGKEDLLQLLHDAMLTSTEISQRFVYEVFQHCCVTRHSYEEEAAAKRREIDGKPRDGRRRAPRSVSIVDPRAKALSNGTHQKDIEVLVYEGFLQFLCVICHLKQPNPLIPYSQRLDVFLRRSLKPLCHHVENLQPLLSRTKSTSKQGGEEKDLSRASFQRDSLRVKRQSLGSN